MRATHLLLDAFGRIREGVEDVVDGLDVDQLGFRPRTAANSIAWLVWHLTRIQDDHVAGVADGAQVWVTRGWSNRFGLPFDVEDTGYGHTSAHVAALQGSTSELLAGYHDVVHQQTVAYLEGLGDADLDRVVDTRWDPPVTLGVRLMSVVGDDMAHLGQAQYVRGLLNLD